jgi:hypothetical protein
VILSLALGIGLQWAFGWRDALIFALLGGLVVAQLVPPGNASCALPRPRDTDSGAAP